MKQDRQEIEFMMTVFWAAGAKPVNHSVVWHGAEQKGCQSVSHLQCPLCLSFSLPHLFPSCLSPLLYTSLGFNLLGSRFPVKYACAHRCHPPLFLIGRSGLMW
jgi:hypothetical protein